MARLTDVHCHLLPEELRPRRARSWDDPWFAACHSAEELTFADGEAVLQAISRDGLEVAVVSGWPFSDPGLLREVNSYVAEQVAGSQGRLVGLATVNPGDPGAVAELRRCRELGLAGLGELNSDAQQFELAFDGGLRQVLLSCAEIDWPVLLHCSEPVGHRYPGKGTATPGRLWPLLLAWLDQAPESRICLAHLGGGLPFYAHMPEVRALCHRLWFDTAAIPYLYAEEVLPALSRLIDDQRICFGSDFPLLPPRRYQGQLSRLDSRQQRLLQEHAPARWLGLPPAGGRPTG